MADIIPKAQSAEREKNMHIVLVEVFVIVALLLGAKPSHTQTATSATQHYGDPQVLKFKDGKLAAFSMQFDDSMETQADFAIPEMNKRGLVGTFFINPASERYERRRQTWEVVCPEHGHELANHTLRHKGAADYEEADREIGGCAHHIWKLYPEKSKLRPFLRGGGTTWSISADEMRELMDRYYLFRAPSRASISDDREINRPVQKAREALANERWGLVGFHGIGGQWISTSEKVFVEMLDFLVDNKDRIWTGTTGDVFRYTQERDAVKMVSLTALSKHSFRISIECDPTKLKLYGRPFTELYDMPLTVQVRVPESWNRFAVEQVGRNQSTAVTRAGATPGRTSPKQTCVDAKQGQDASRSYGTSVSGSRLAEVSGSKELTAGSDVAVVTATRSERRVLSRK